MIWASLSYDNQGESHEPVVRSPQNTVAMPRNANKPGHKSKPIYTENVCSNNMTPGALLQSPQSETQDKDNFVDLRSISIIVVAFFQLQETPLIQRRELRC